jgi:5,10-methylenetetrahydrofolate reductase
VTQPTTGPALTPTQQNEINAANQLQAEADLANGVFQIAAAADPSLAPDAMLAAKAHALVDSIVPQYVADVTAGQTPPATLLAQITTDVAQVLSITASHPATAAAYEKAHAGR